MKKIITCILSCLLLATTILFENINPNMEETSIKEQTVFPYEKYVDNLGVDTDFSITIGDYTVYVGDQYLEIPINGTWSEPFNGLYIKVLYDETKIQVNSVDWSDTVFEGLNYIGPWINYGTGWFSIEKYAYTSGIAIPAGEGMLAKVKISILEDASSGITFLNFTDGEHLTAYYPNCCSDWTNPMIPELYNGIFTIIQESLLETPDQPEGPTQGLVRKEYTYTTNEIPNSGDISYYFSWGDDTYSDWITIPSDSHLWSERGTYEVKVKIKDSLGFQSDWSDPLEIRIAILGDMNNDGAINGLDIDPLTLALNDPDAYEVQYNLDPVMMGDINQDGVLNELDLDVFTELIVSGNHRPYRPIITGPTTGNTGETYDYTVVTTDAEWEDIKYYIDWGDGTFDEWVGPYASGIPVTKSHTWEEQGQYNVKVKARDINEAESGWSPITTISIVAPTPQLQISVPISVVEGERFGVNVTSDDTPIEDATVEFNGESNTTDSSGQVAFTAPNVAVNKEYIITATLEGYVEDTATIIVLNQEEKRGWIWGYVTDNYRDPIENASVCVKIVDENNVINSECTITSKTGTYSKSIPVGTYQVEASKSGYESSTKNVTIIENKAIPIDFVLENYSEPVPNEIQDKIDDAIVTGKVSGEITFQKTAEDEIRYDTTVYIYDVAFTVTDIKEDSISLIVSADDDVIGNTLVIMLEGVFDSDEIGLKVNGREIPNADNLDDVLNAHDDNGMVEKYLIKENILYLLISFPHYSEYEITIYTVIEALGGPVAVALYVVVAIVAFILFVIPGLKGPYPPIYYRKKKKQ